MSGLVALDARSAPRLAELHATAFDEPWSATDFADLVDLPGVATLGVEDEEGLVGLILIRTVADEAEILTLAVAPSARRGGIGLALTQAACGACAAAGAQVLWLEVAVDNAAALALYGRAGFEVSGRRPAYYARNPNPPVDAVVMRRLLNTATG
jgi:ribosomal-protein-alanine N-acetyltransferase